MLLFCVPPPHLAVRPTVVVGGDVVVPTWLGYMSGGGHAASSSLTMKKGNNTDAKMREWMDRQGQTGRDKKRICSE